MVWQKARFHLICACVLLLSLAVTACASSPGQPVAQSGTPAPHITFQGETDQQQSQTIEINNCDGKAAAERTERRAQTVSVAVSNELAATLGVDAQVISAEVQAAVGVTQSEVDEKSTEITLTAPPGTRMIIELAWLGKEQLGVAENVQGWAVPIAFKRFIPSDVRIIYQNDIDNCPASPGGNPPAASTPPPQEPTQNSGSPGDQAAPKPIREHYQVKVGDGMFTKGTFSDGQAPYSEDWLWANNHFKIQRIRREEQPDGCDVSRYNSNLIWISGTPGMSITINDQTVGTYTIREDAHGYIFEWPVRMGDKLCAVGFAPIGFQIIIGPDIYYHYDSYCYRGACAN